MAIRVRVPASLGAMPGLLPGGAVEIAPPPPTIGALLAELARRYPGLGPALDSSAVNAAVNGEVVLSGRDLTPLKDGDEVEFLVMFAGG